MSLNKELKLDELARHLCKPLGCKAMACVNGRSPGGCQPEIAALNACLRQKRKEIDTAIQEGRDPKTIPQVE